VCAGPAEIIGMGNPLIFWGSIPAFAYAVFAWLRGIELRAIGRYIARALGAAMVGVVLFNLAFAVFAGATDYQHWGNVAPRGSLAVGAAVFAVFVLTFLSSRGRWQAGFVVQAVAWQYFPWFFATRTNFLFYMTPITPFLVLVGVSALKDLSEVRIGTDRVRALAPIAGFLAVAAIGLFVFFLPVLTGKTLSYEMWKARIWFPSWI
jgi:dolichyl-phosphate-mannose--protein O-mannosyl transferase